MKASTISVLMTGSTSIHMYASHKRRTFNLSVRFDQGDAATVCGYPQQAVIWDVPVEHFNSEAPTGREYLEDCGELPRGYFYVSEDDEIKVLEAAIRGIKRQAKDPMFKDHVTDAYRLECILKLQAALVKLQGGQAWLAKFEASVGGTK